MSLALQHIRSSILLQHLLQCIGGGILYKKQQQQNNSCCESQTKLKVHISRKRAQLTSMSKQ